MKFDACFTKLTDADKEALKAKAGTRQFKSGDAIINEGDQVDELLVVQSGMLRVVQSKRQAFAAEFIGPLGPGNAIGEMSFLDGGKASATLFADGDVEVYAFSRSAIDELLESDPGFAARFYLSLFIELASKLRTTNLRVQPPSL
jgi:CRP-like cAMP-binding protein